jgi:hypothetical protein
MEHYSSYRYFCKPLLPISFRKYYIWMTVIMSSTFVTEDTAKQRNTFSKMIIRLFILLLRTIGVHFKARSPYAEGNRGGCQLLHITLTFRCVFFNMINFSSIIWIYMSTVSFVTLTAH